MAEDVKTQDSLDGSRLLQRNVAMFAENGKISVNRDKAVTYATIKDTKPKDMLKAIDVLALATEQVTKEKPSGRTDYEISDPKDAESKREVAWYTTQIAIAQLKAPNDVKGKLFDQAMDALDKVNKGIGRVDISGKELREEGIEDLKSFREALKQADKKYGTMSADEYKKWLDTEIDKPKKDSSAGLSGESLGQLPAPSLVAAMQAAKNLGMKMS